MLNQNVTRETLSADYPIYGAKAKITQRPGKQWGSMILTGQRHSAIVGCYDTRQEAQDAADVVMTSITNDHGGDFASWRDANCY